MKEEINIDEYMKDSMGRLVPMDLVPEIDKERDSPLSRNWSTRPSPSRPT